MNGKEAAGRFSELFCACLRGWKTYARCPWRECAKCRLGKWRA